jgi:hypothetical protein
VDIWEGVTSGNLYHEAEGRGMPCGPMPRSRRGKKVWGQPRVSTLEILKINGFGLTRHINVRSMKNTRSCGLEMLKGRWLADESGRLLRKIGFEARRATIGL